MARVILVYGQPAAGKSYSLRNLDPNSTVIIDADTKGALPWRGWKKNFSVTNKNFYKLDDINKITSWVAKIGDPNKESKIRTLVIDGLNSAMSFAQHFNPDRSFQGWADLGRSILTLIRTAKNARDDLDIIITAHVEPADPNSPTSIDHIKTPGKMIDKIGLESLLLYVFYAKCDDGNYFFETQGNHSSARSPEGCFPPTVPNDIKAVIDTINIYDQGE